MQEGFHGAEGGLIHQLQTGRDQPGGDHCGHRRAGLLDVGESRQQHLSGGRSGQELDHRFHDHPEQALGTADQRQEVVARGVQPGAAEGEELAVRGDQAHFEEIVDGQAVLEAVHAAGVFRHVAADGAGDLRRGSGA